MFAFYRSNGRPNGPDIVQLPAAAGTYIPGTTLVLTAGVATLATGTTVPTHVCAESKTLAAGETGTVSAYRILPGDVYQTEFGADGSAVVLGSKVTIGASGGQVTATTTGGVATVQKKLGSGAAGTGVLVSF